MCQNMKLVHQETQFCKLGFKIENFHNLEFFSYEISLIFPNFAQHFHHDAIGFKQNFQHESCSPAHNIQLLFTKFSKNMLGSQVMIM